jgi:hypothetical protein
LCKHCHGKYDRVDAQKTVATKSEVKTEGDIIERLVANQMNKTKAMKIVRSKNLGDLTHSNTIFSNVRVQDSWWLQTDNRKFKNLLHFILNDNKTRKLYFSRLPPDAVVEPALHFKQRNDTYRSDCSGIYILSSSVRFKEKNGFDFTKFLLDSIAY